jgi:hypothetical protein
MRFHSGTLETVYGKNRATPGDFDGRLKYADFISDCLKGRRAHGIGRFSGVIHFARGQTPRD